jgi:hypothetical protein
VDFNSITTDLQHTELPKSKTRTKELTVAEVKKMIYKEIQKKKKSVDPEKFDTRIVENRLAEEEAMEQKCAVILDEELRRKRQTDQQMKLGEDNQAG